MKKLALSILLLFTTVLLFTLPTYATSTSYTWNIETTHSFQTMPINQTRVLVDGVAVFEYGVILDTNYFVDFTNVYEFETSSKLIHLSTGSFKSISYSNSTYLKTGSGTYFDDKTVTWEIDYDYIPTTVYHQIQIYNYTVILERYFVEDGTVITKPSDPTRSGYDFVFWIDQIKKNNDGFVEEYNFNEPITESKAINAHYVSSTTPTWIYDTTYGSSDYDYHYLTNLSTTHQLISTNLNYLSIFADGELIYDRGINVNINAYTITNGVGVEFQITDVVNTTTATYNTTGTISNNITTIDELVIIHSESPQNIYVFDDETMHPFHNLDIYHFDIYRNEIATLKDGITDSLYTFKWLSAGLLIEYENNTKSITFRNMYNPSSPYSIARTNETSTWTLVYTNDETPIFDTAQTFNHTVGTDVLSVSISNGNTVTLHTDSINPLTTSIPLGAYMSDLTVGQAYKITYDGVISSFDVEYTVLTDIFSPIFIPGLKNIQLSSSAFYHDSSITFKYVQGMEFHLNLTDISFDGVNPTTFKLYIEEILAHDVTFDQPFLLFSPSSRFKLMSMTRQMEIIPIDSLDNQLVEHYEQAYDPTHDFITETDGKYDIIAYLDENGIVYDFNDPVVEDEILDPVVIPNHDYEIAFDSTGGTTVETQYLFDGEYVSQPTSPTKPGYTFGGWYQLPNMPSGLEAPVTELNNHSLREVFESTIPALENLITGSGPTFSNTTGYLPIVVDRDGISVVNNKLRTTALIADGNLGFSKTPNIALTVNSVYYIKINGYTTSGGGTKSLRLQTSIPTTVYNFGTNTSLGFIATQTNTSFLFYVNSANTLWQINDYWEMSSWVLFNLTASHGVTSTSGTAYDNAVAEIEWILSKNNGYIQTVGNPFQIVDLSVSQMDYWYSLYDYFQNGTSLDLSSATEYDFSVQPTASTVLFAKWIENDPNTYTVTFNSSQGSYVAPVNVLDGGLITRPSDPYREGYEFKGWSLSSVGSTLFDFTTETITADTTLYAVWDIPIEETVQTVHPFWNFIATNYIWISVGILAIGKIFLTKHYRRKRGYR